MRLKKLRFPSWFKVYGIIFLLGIFFDAGSMTANEMMKYEYQKGLMYFSFTQEQRDVVYFVGQSASRVFYIWATAIYTKEYFIVNLIATFWTGFALGDTIEELIGDNTKHDWIEYIIFFITLTIVLYKIRVHKSKKKEIGFLIRKSL